LVVRISVSVWSSSITAMPTMVLPAPHGMTMTPLPPRSLPPAWKTAAASRWYARSAKERPASVVFRTTNESAAPCL
jgi:hypothetical protein